MKTSCFIFLLTCFLWANDTTYSTTEIIEYILEPSSLPNFTISTRGRAGYGTSEFLYEEPRTDLYGGVLLSFDILSTADKRKREEVQNGRRAEVLALLSQIKEHLNLAWQYRTQREAYTERLAWYKERIALNIEEHSVVYPIERILIDLNAKIYSEQSKIQRAQLAISAYAGEEWERLYSVVQAWDKVL